MATYVVQQDGVAGLGLVSKVLPARSSIDPQQPLALASTRQVILEPNNVGTGSGGSGTGGGETSVVF
jgi:hypothetical protein